VLKAAGAGGFLMLLAFDKKNNGFISIKNVLTLRAVAIPLSF
jgi:hypothetical protein